MWIISTESSVRAVFYAYVNKYKYLNDFSDATGLEKRINGMRIYIDVLWGAGVTISWYVMTS